MHGSRAQPLPKIKEGLVTYVSFSSGFQTANEIAEQLIICSTLQKKKFAHVLFPFLIIGVGEKETICRQGKDN